MIGVPGVGFVMLMRKPIIPDDAASKCFFYNKNIQGGSGCVVKLAEPRRMKIHVPPWTRGDFTGVSSY
jgi:hypothetical protein